MRLMMARLMFGPPFTEAVGNGQPLRPRAVGETLLRDTIVAKTLANGRFVYKSNNLSDGTAVPWRKKTPAISPSPANRISCPAVLRTLLNESFRKSG